MEKTMNCELQPKLKGSKELPVKGMDKNDKEYHYPSAKGTTHPAQKMGRKK